MSPVWAPHGIIIYIDIVLSGISYAYSRVHGTSIIELHSSQHTSFQVVTVCLETLCVSATNGTTNHSEVETVPSRNLHFPGASLVLAFPPV